MEGNVRVLRGGLRLEKGGNIVIQEGSSLTIVEGSNPSTLNGKILLSEGSKLEFDDSENVDLSQLESLDIEEGARLVRGRILEDSEFKVLIVEEGEILRIKGEVKVDKLESYRGEIVVESGGKLAVSELWGCSMDDIEVEDGGELKRFTRERILEDSEFKELIAKEGEILRIRGEVKADELVAYRGEVVVESGGKLAVSKLCGCRMNEIEVEDGGELIRFVRERILEDCEVEEVKVEEWEILRIKGEVKAGKIESNRGKIVVESGGKLAVSKLCGCRMNEIEVEDGGELIRFVRERILEDCEVEEVKVEEWEILRIKGEVKAGKIESNRGKIVVESGGKLAVSKLCGCRMNEIEVEDGGELICTLGEMRQRLEKSEIDLKPGSKFKIIVSKECKFLDNVSINIEEGAELIFENNNPSGEKIKVSFKSDREKYTGKGVVQFIGKAELDGRGMKVFPWRIKMPPVGEELEFFNGLLKREKVELESSGCCAWNTEMITLYIGHFGGKKTASIRGRIYEFYDDFCNYEFVYDDE